MATQELIQDNAQELQARIITTLMTGTDAETKLPVDLELHILIARDTARNRGRKDNGKPDFTVRVLAAFYQGIDLMPVLYSGMVGEGGDGDLYSYAYDHVKSLYETAADSPLYQLEVERTPHLFDFNCPIPEIRVSRVGTDAQVVTVTAVCIADPAKREIMEIYQLQQLYLDRVPVMGNKVYDRWFQRDLWDYAAEHLESLQNLLDESIADYPLTFNEYWEKAAKDPRVLGTALQSHAQYLRALDRLNAPAVAA